METLVKKEPAANGGTAELPPLITQDTFWRAMGGAMGRNSVRRFVSEGKIRSIAVGNKRLIPRSELFEFADREAR